MHSPFFLSSYLLGPAHFASFQPSFYTPSPLNALEIQNLLIQLSSENPIRNSSSSSSFSSAVVVGADERERMDQMFRYRVSSRRLKLAFSSGWIIPRAHWLVCKPMLALSRRFNNFPGEAAIAIPLEYPRARTFSLSLSLSLPLPPRVSFYRVGILPRFVSIFINAFAIHFIPRLVINFFPRMRRGKRNFLSRYCANFVNLAHKWKWSVLR